MKHCRYEPFLLTHLDLYYEEASTEIKQNLLGSIFPEKLVFENGKYRTTKINEAIALISGYKKEFDVKNEGQTISIDNLSYDVPFTDLTSNQFTDGMRKIFELEPFINICSANTNKINGKCSLEEAVASL